MVALIKILENRDIVPRHNPEAVKHYENELHNLGFRFDVDMGSS